MERLEFFAGAPAGFDPGLLEPTIAVAAARAGAIGFLDGELASDAVVAAALSEIRMRCQSGCFALKLSLTQWSEAVQCPTLHEQLASSRVRWVVFALGEAAGGLPEQPLPAPQLVLHRLHLLEEPARTRAIELLIAVDNGLPMHGLDAVRATDRLAQIVLSELDVKRGAHDAPH